MSADEQNRVDECEECEARTDAELANANERANEWEGLAASRWAKLKEARAHAESMRDTYVPVRNAIDLMERLEAVGYGKPGTPNTLYCMVLAACDDIERLRQETAEAKLIARGVEEGAAEWEDDCKEAQARVAKLYKNIAELGTSIGDHQADILILRANRDNDKTRIALLEKSLRFIERVDKTPAYRCKGTNADRDRHGQLPKKSGQRWKTPREIVGDLKLPAE